MVLASIYQGLGRSLEIGSMSFSFLGLAYAVLVLLLTQAAARLWRWIFQTKFLNRSGMEVGLQDSITTITVYVIWMLGILVALHVFGLNTASLAVAFGALGIGLGFGLQNIFNNFISGIILLFERPIQVGDDVEINGTWATVKKINVVLFLPFSPASQFFGNKGGHLVDAGCVGKDHRQPVQPQGVARRCGHVGQIG